MSSASALNLDRAAEPGQGRPSTHPLRRRWRPDGAGGIAYLLQDGVIDFLVHSVDGCAYALRRPLDNSEMRRQMGAPAREHARRALLRTRHLADDLQVLRLSAATQ